MKEPGIHQVKIADGFWAEKQRLNSGEAIFYQWNQLEATRCIDNFRVTAGLKEGFREGFFFSDSDAYKWLDAASRILAISQNAQLAALVNDFIELLEKAQTEDGYLYTYNQIHFPGQRWTNLQIQHEFYCLGHLIEAGISHFESTGMKRLLNVGQKAADLLVRDFSQAAPDYTDGHEEIEIALIKLWRVTSKKEYLDLSRAFLQRRGRINHFTFKFVQQTLNTGKRMKEIEQQRKRYQLEHPGEAALHLPERNKHKTPFLVMPRFAASALNGKYNQQHEPLANQRKAEGHSVRFAYLQTAAAMLEREAAEKEETARLLSVWENMTSRRMYVTGGIGSLPVSEGFGNDFELDPEFAYAETCAALGSMFWSHEMALLTGKACFEDLFEWQLYNAASVGIARDGHSYFYNNPLECHGGITRAGWYNIPCCPSNLSRVWASLGRNIYTFDETTLYVNQYISSEARLDFGRGIELNMQSDLPWGNRVSLKIGLVQPVEAVVKLRLPSWADSCHVYLNDAVIQPEISDAEPDEVTANGLHFNRARWMTLSRVFNPGDLISLEFNMPIRLIRQDRRVPKCGGKVAVTCGPVVYCLESADNPAGVLNTAVVPESLKAVYNEHILGGTWSITGQTQKGKAVTFIPYMLWGNRGEAQMTVFVDAASGR